MKLNPVREYNTFCDTVFYNKIFTPFSYLIIKNFSDKTRNIIDSGIVSLAPYIVRNQIHRISKDNTK